MNFYDFFVFVPRFALANIVELYHIQNPKETALSSTETANHFVYNLIISMPRIFVTSQNKTGMLSLISSKYWKKRASAGYWWRCQRHIDTGQRDCLKMKDSSQKGCLSVTCLKSDHNVVGDITSFKRGFGNTN
uniref:Uncharacterized protein n=1 Tax=Oryza glumipatula TaxID=40148 RepID=A0A0D9YAA6_9ORYZ